jgi:hypothetical protein
MPISANVVAVVAILAGLAGVWLTNRNQRRIIRDQYVRDHVTQTYSLLMKGVYLRGVMLTEAATLPTGEQSALKPNDLVSDLETQFGSSLMTYDSPSVNELWLTFDERTDALRAILMDLRRQHGVPPAEIPGIDGMAEVLDGDAKWHKAKQDLVNQVRAELEFKHRLVSWHLRSRALNALRQARGQS